MMRFGHMRIVDGEVEYYFDEQPHVCQLAAPPPEIEPHVMANYVLSHELEAEYLNQGRRRGREIGHSTTARKHFRDNEARGRYFDRLAEALRVPDWIEVKWAAEAVAREKTYEDVILAFGGRFTGESQVLPGRIRATGSMDGGVVNQT